MTYLTEHLNACKLNFKKLRALAIVMLSLTILITLLLAPVNLFVAEAEEEPAPTGPKANQVLTSEDGRVTINFHPELQRESGPYPVLRVQGRPISQDFMDNFLKLYMSDLTLYPAKLITMQEELADVEERIEELEDRPQLEDEADTQEGYLTQLGRLQAGGLEGLEIWEPDPKESPEETLSSLLDYTHSLQAEDPEHFMLAGEGKNRYSLVKLYQPQSLTYFSFTYQKTSYPTKDSCYAATPLNSALNPYGRELSQGEAEKISDLAKDNIEKYYVYDAFYPSEVGDAEDFGQYVDQIAEQTDPYFDKTILFPVPKWSRDEALQKADDLVKSLGLGHLQLAYQDAAVARSSRYLPAQPLDQLEGKTDYNLLYLTPVWRFIYYPSYAGHTFAYNVDSIANRPFVMDDVSPERLVAPWCFESLVFSLGADGLISLSYSSPMEATAEISPEAQLLPEEDILSLAETMLLRREEDLMLNGDRSPQSKLELNVEYATLTPYRILDQDDPLQGTIVPVWNFYGSKNQVYPGEDDKLIFEHTRNPYESLLTLNALDGTVIDLTKGK